MELNERNDAYHPFTDKKHNLFASKLAFENIDQSRMSYLNVDSYDDIPQMSGKKFLSLIEESLNEVSDNYYGVLGSQDHS